MTYKRRKIINQSPALQNQHFYIPGFKDPRWLLTLSLLFFAVVLILDPAFGKSFYQLATAVSVTVGLDLFINLFIKKKKHFPLSSLSTSVGMTLIIFSPYVWPFALIPIFAALSKFFVKYKGLHIFNPNNCGMVLAFLFLNSYISTTYGRWTDSPALFFSVIFLGLIVSYRAKRLDMSLAFLTSFVVFALIRGAYKDMSLAQSLLPLTNAIYFIFAFYHMTDPITTPRNRNGRIIFAILVGLFDNVLRVYEIKYSPFYALFFMASIQPFFENLFQRDYQRESWNHAPLSKAS